MIRTYEETHPWLRFSLEPDAFPRDLWMLLGEARSKCEHLAGVPLKPATADRLHRIYLAKGVLATTAIEGNTLSMDEVEKYLDGNLHLPPSQEYLKTEIENIVQACNMVVKHGLSGNGMPLSVEVFQSFNKMVLHSLKVAEEVSPGQFRKHEVGVARYRGAPWQDCPFLLQKLVEWLDALEREHGKELGLASAILRAAVAHLYFAWIHPFGDGNGRTARLIEFTILIAGGVPVPAAHLLSDHYNRTRAQYYQELDRASRAGGNIVPFVCYAIQGFVDGLREQIDHVRRQQLEVAWTNYIHEVLGGGSESAQRRRKLIFALTGKGGQVRTRDAMGLTPDLAILYAHKTTKTLARDLNALKKLDLIVHDGPRVEANTSLLAAFLPRRASRRPTNKPPPPVEG
jgi:Fic family protein